MLSKKTLRLFNTITYLANITNFLPCNLISPKKIFWLRLALWRANVGFAILNILYFIGQILFNLRSIWLGLPTFLVIYMVTFLSFLLVCVHMMAAVWVGFPDIQTHTYRVFELNAQLTKAYRLKLRKDGLEALFFMTAAVGFCLPFMATPLISQWMTIFPKLTQNAYKRYGGHLAESGVIFHIFIFAEACIGCVMYVGVAQGMLTIKWLEYCCRQKRNSLTKLVSVYQKLQVAFIRLLFVVRHILTVGCAGAIGLATIALFLFVRTFGEAGVIIVCAAAALELAISIGFVDILFRMSWKLRKASEEYPVIIERWMTLGHGDRCLLQSLRPLKIRIDPFFTISQSTLLTVVFDVIVEQAINLILSY